MIGKAKIIDHVKRLQVIDKLFAFFFLPKKSVLFVESSQQLGLAQQLSQVVS